MIKKLINGYEEFECSQCGEETYVGADYCQTCGHYFNSIQNEVVLEDDAEDDETMCILVMAKKAGIFTFTQLKRDRTPKALLELPSFQFQRIMAEAQPYEFYVFKTNKYPFLSEGTQVNLNLDNYEHFSTSSGYRIYYDKEHFTIHDINELKTYSFN